MEITVKEAIAELEKRKEFLTAQCDGCWDPAIEMALQALKRQQWHTGEPTEDGDYLCYKYGDDDGFRYFYVDTYYTHNGAVEYGTPLAYKGWQDGHDRVLAWMPLPEAPEVEE